MNPNYVLRVIIADDKRVQVDGFCVALKYASEVRVVNTISALYEVAETVIQMKPDVLMLDLSWHDNNEVVYPVIREIKDKAPGTAILAMSDYSECLGIASQRRIADFVINKQYLSDKGTIVARITDAYQAHKRSQTDLSPVRLEDFGLTRREKEVLDLLCQGMQNKDIANGLFISIATVKDHLKKIYGKMDVNNRGEAIKKALSSTR